LPRIYSKECCADRITTFTEYNRGTVKAEKGVGGTGRRETNKKVATRQLPAGAESKTMGARKVSHVGMVAVRNGGPKGGGQTSSAAGNNCSKHVLERGGSWAGILLGNVNRRINTPGDRGREKRRTRVSVGITPGQGWPAPRKNDRARHPPTGGTRAASSREKDSNALAGRGWSAAPVEEEAKFVEPFVPTRT